MAAYLKGDSSHFSSAPWPFPSPHLHHDTSKTPNIYLVVSLLWYINSFGCHPEYCAMCVCIGIGIVCPLGEFKIWYFTDSCRFNQDVLPFNILRVTVLRVNTSEINEEKLTRWKILWEWRYSRPARICSVNDLVTSSSNLPFFCKQLSMEPPGIYSKKLRANF